MHRKRHKKNRDQPTDIAKSSSDCLVGAAEAPQLDQRDIDSVLVIEE